MKGPELVPALEWTGERLLPGCNRPLVFEHLHRYAMACALAQGKRVLDIACGEGYGSNLLAQSAVHVLGVDIDAATIAHATARYEHRNLRFLQGSCTEIPCEDHSIDLVASFETIEHIAEHERFLAELKRVLTPGGIVIISSPDKTIYRKLSEKGNRFHYGELTHEEFLRIMQQKFAHCIAGRQRLVVGSWSAPDAPSAQTAAVTFRGDFHAVENQAGVKQGIYSLALCSDAELPVVAFGLFEDAKLSAEIWHLLDQEAAPGELGAGVGSRARALEEKVRHVEILQREVDEKSRQVLHFKQESDVQTAASERLRLELALADERLARLTSQFQDARWEVLTARSRTLRADPANAMSMTAESERDALREMVKQLQTQLEGTAGELRRLKERLQLVRNSLGHRMLLPFSSAQRKLRRVTQLPADD